MLPIGIHVAAWEELVKRFGFNEHRLIVLDGLKKGLNLLFRYGCKEVCIDGSFTTNKPFPNDIDVCYDNSQMEWKKFIKEQPEFNDSKKGGFVQKAKYQSEFYAYNAYDDYILQFFQFDRNNNPKGIVKLFLTEPLV